MRLEQGFQLTTTALNYFAIIPRSLLLDDINYDWLTSVVTTDQDL